jgi:hypothetical protein
MTSSREWLGSGAARIAAGILLILGHLVDGGASGTGASVAGLRMALAAHLIMILVLIGIYVTQASCMRLIGPLGMILSVLGTALVSGVVLVEIAGAGGTAVENVLTAGIAGVLTALAGWASLWGCCCLHLGDAGEGVPAPSISIPWAR